LEHPKQIAILGSTGSIGTQALEVIDKHPNLFKASVLTANNNADLLIEQSLKFKPHTVVIGNQQKYQQVKDVLSSHNIIVKAGETALQEVVTYPEIELVLTAVVGFCGLLPTIKAIEKGKTIALANKETLVVAGEIITALAQTHKVAIYPVDSEHSAIFQCLVGEDYNSIEKVILTASGGPFRGKNREQLANVSKAQALKHPNWEMGAKITIDSASLMNKGLEVIEAKWLFNLLDEQIDVVVHPQSIIHSMVQFNDGSIKAQMGLPDMKLPIHYALAYPKRIESDYQRFDFLQYPSLTFEQPDKQTFKCLQLAFDAMKKGGNTACVLNAANEIAVARFLKDEIKFLEIAELIESVIEKAEHLKQPSVNDLLESDKKARNLAKVWR